MDYSAIALGTAMIASLIAGAATRKLPAFNAMVACLAVYWTLRIVLGLIIAGPVWMHGFDGARAFGASVAVVIFAMLARWVAKRSPVA